MSNLTHLSAQAQAWQSFAAARARFDVARKVTEALAFSRDRGARSFALPTKLEGTAQFQTNLRDVLDAQAAGLRFAELEVKADPAEGGALIVCWGGLILGLIQKKHVGWVRPLLATRRLRFFLLQVTGGTKDKPTMGCNVAVAGIPGAIEAQAPGYGWHVRSKVSAEYAA